jgi:uncharacterized protein (TIGR03437 family)
VGGQLSFDQPAPAIAAAGIVAAVAPSQGPPFAPGQLVSINGSQLSAGAFSAEAGNLPTYLGQTGVFIAVELPDGSAGVEKLMPLAYASGGQVIVQIPYGVNPNTSQRLLLEWGPKFAAPVDVDIAVAAPQIGQLNSQTTFADSSANPIGPSNPAHAQDTVTIYCTGLGAVAPAIADGALTPAAGGFAVQTPLTVTIGGQNATVLSAALAPASNGIYQIVVTVPSGTGTGDEIPVQIAAGGQTSAPAPISVR